MNGHSPEVAGILDEQRELCRRFDKLEEGLLGTVERPGLVGMVRSTNDTVILMKSDFGLMKTDINSLKTEVERLKRTEARAKGALAAAGGMGGIVGFLLNWIFNHTPKT